MQKHNRRSFRYNIPKPKPGSVPSDRAGQNNRPKCGGCMYRKPSSKQTPHRNITPKILAPLVSDTRCMDLSWSIKNRKYCATVLSGVTAVQLKQGTTHFKK